MRFPLIKLSCYLLSFVLVHAAAAPAASLASPRWATLMASLGPVALNGQAHIQLSIRSSTLDALGIRVSLVHRIAGDPWGKPFSDWSVEGLKVYLSDGPDGSLFFHGLNGTTRTFPRAEIRPAFDPAKAGWQIVENEEVGIAVRTPQGTTYHLRAGLLYRLDHPRLGPLAISTQGSMVRRIENGIAASAGDPALVEAVYDDRGRLLNLRYNGVDDFALAWEGHVLSHATRRDGSAVQFEYAGRLLAGIDGNKFSWTVNPDADAWPEVMAFLAADSHRTYSYDLNAEGLKISIKANVPGIESLSLRYNPLRNRVVSEKDDGVTVFYLREGAIPPGFFERIEDGSGEVVERYDYDEKGLLQKIQRTNEAPIYLKYGPTGTLVDWRSKPFTQP